jgi:MFS transporter, PPP family, 3-phenylpropionic acid transporter
LAIASPLLLLGAFYFFSFGGLGALFPFLPLLLSSRGLSPSRISLVMVLVPAANIVMPPLWGSLADALRARVQLLRIATFGTAASVLLLLPDGGFAGSFAALAAFSTFRSPLTALADTTTCVALSGQNERFGRVRAWGSVGFGLFVLLPGLLGGSAHPRPLLLATAAIYLASAFATLGLEAPPPRRERGILRATLVEARRPEMVLVLAASAVYYLGHALYDAYFSLHARSLGLDDGFIGLLWSVGTGAEVVVMLLVPGVLARRGGAAVAGGRGDRSTALLIVAGCAAVLRWALLSWIGSGAALLAQQPLHGLTYGAWYLSLIQFVQSRAPERLRTSLQSLVWATLGVGTVAGYLVGGQLLERGRGELLYRTAAVAAAASLGLYIALARHERARSRSHPQVEGGDGQ